MGRCSWLVIDAISNAFGGPVRGDGQYQGWASIPNNLQEGLEYDLGRAGVERYANGTYGSTGSGLGEHTTTTKLYLATNNGLVMIDISGRGWRVVGRTLEDQHVTSVIAREGVILAGTRHGVFRSDDSGQSWDKASAGLTHQHVRWLAYHPDRSDLEFAGTEPAAIFVSHDGAKTWRECSEVAELRNRFRWFLPYSPQAGCVRLRHSRRSDLCGCGGRRAAPLG
jgi:hypothetical protein